MSKTGHGAMSDLNLLWDPERTSFECCSRFG